MMPEVLKELKCGLTGEEGKPRYATTGTDIEGQVACDASQHNAHVTTITNNNQQRELHIALLSLCVTACEKLHLDIDAISPREGDRGEGAPFRFAMKMVELNGNAITADGLAMMKLTTRFVIAAMKKHTAAGHGIVKPADLDSFMSSLPSISKTMLHVEGSMVFATVKKSTAETPVTVETLDSLVKQAEEHYGQIEPVAVETLD
uniref:Uncharacterized protein n=1 Tax=Avena sativa TaxID=4498 RepID=A0ACD5ZLQ8_AVESA